MLFPKKVKRLSGVIAGLIGMVLLTNCSSEDNLPGFNEPQKFNGTSLKISYCGQAMPGKQLIYLPEEIAASGKIVCTGSTNLDQLSSLGLSGEGAAPGIIPGSPVIEWPVTLTKGRNEYGFQGEGFTDYVSGYKYKGKIYKDSCVLQITDVELANTALSSSVWTPSPIKRDGLSYSSFPFHLVWEVDPVAALDIDLTELLYLGFSMPVIPVYNNTAYSSIAQLYIQSVQTFAFKENGNIIIRYYSSVGGATQLMTTNGNTFQYVLPSDNVMLVYPNPTTLFGRWLVAQSDAGDNPDISFTPNRSTDDNEAIKALLMGLLKEMVPVILEMTEVGIPMNIDRSETVMSVYLNTQTILSIMQKLLSTIEQDPAVMQKIIGWIDANDNIPLDAQNVAELLNNLKTILAYTTKFEIGLNFNAYK